jgi:hypothetical protein
MMMMMRKKGVDGGSMKCICPASGHAPIEFLEELAVERVGRFQVQFILRVESRPRDVVHARPKRLRSVLRPT